MFSNRSAYSAPCEGIAEPQTWCQEDPDIRSRKAVGNKRELSNVSESWGVKMQTPIGRTFFPDEPWQKEKSQKQKLPNSYHNIEFPEETRTTIRGRNCAVEKHLWAPAEVESVTTRQVAFSPTTDKTCSQVPASTSGSETSWLQNTLAFDKTTTRTSHYKGMNHLISCNPTKGMPDLCFPEPCSFNNYAGLPQKSERPGAMAAEFDAVCKDTALT